MLISKTNKVIKGRFRVRHLIVDKQLSEDFLDGKQIEVDSKLGKVLVDKGIAVEVEQKSSKSSKENKNSKGE